MTVDEMNEVNHPAHYRAGGIEAIDYIEQVVAHYPPEIAYHVGNALKYLARAPHKGAMQQDLAKGSWYLTRAINRLEYVQRAASRRDTKQAG